MNYPHPPVEGDVVLSSCPRVSVRSIVGKLEEKVGRERLVREGQKTKSISAITMDFPTHLESSCRTQRTVGSHHPQRQWSIASSIGVPDNICLINPQEHEYHQQQASPGGDEEDHSSVGSFLLKSPTGGASGRSSLARSFRTASRTIDPEELPPAFRASLRGQLAEQGLNLVVPPSILSIPSAPPVVPKKEIAKLSQPAKLHRTWPPVPKRRSDIQIHCSSAGATTSCLHHGSSNKFDASLSELRKTARVQSQIKSFEETKAAASAAHLMEIDTNSSGGSNNLIAADEEDQAMEINDSSRRDDDGDDSSYTLPLTGLDSTQTLTSTQNNKPPPTSPFKTRADVAGDPNMSGGLVSALKSGRCKGSLRIRWRGPEVFFIEARNGKDFQPLYYDDLREDRFKVTTSSDHTCLSVATAPSLLADRFGGGATGMGDDSLPARPARPRRDEWSDDGSSDADLSTLEGHSTAMEDPVTSTKGRENNQHFVGGDDLLPSDPPAIWITVYDTEPLRWRVKRVWDDQVLDQREKDRIIPDEDLLNTVKNLSGLPALPPRHLEAAHSLSSALGEENYTPAGTVGGNLKTGEADDVSLGENWSIKKFYDIDGEIIEEFYVSDGSLDETDMLNEIEALAKETPDLLSDKASADTIPTALTNAILPPPPLTMGDKWDDMAAQRDAPAIKPSPQYLRCGSSIQSCLSSDTREVVEEKDCHVLDNAKLKSSFSAHETPQRSNLKISSPAQLVEPEGDTASSTDIIKRKRQERKKEEAESARKGSKGRKRPSHGETKKKERSKLKGRCSLADLLSPPGIVYFGSPP